jgi:putative DNA primase/helicase
MFRRVSSSSSWAAAGTFGPPRLGKWDFTRRGLEESAEERNDLTVILDDTESHNEEHLSFKSALRYVNQIVTSGQSKTISRVARKAQLPSLSWTAWGLTSSPESLEQIATGIGWKRTNGERVRFIDIPVPPVSEGGIFDWLQGDELQRIEQSKQLIDQLDEGVTGNYGGIFPLWIKFLLSTNRAEQVCRLTERFVTRVAASADGYNERFAKKFAVPAIAGYLAAKYGIVPWPKMWPVEAAECCYNLAIKAVRKDADVAGKKIQLIAKFATNPNRFIPGAAGGAKPQHSHK